MSELAALEVVNNAITECMDKDEQPWDYYDQLQSSQNGRYDYNYNRLIKLNEICIPEAIINNNNNNNLMIGGFFELINRAYFIINSSIYLWDYSNRDRWCCLNQFDDIITSICLVKSKKNIFIEKIQYLLIVATKNEIIIIGIGFTNNSINGEIEAFPTKYKISTDGVIINKIISDSISKRIFLCCSHGNVYEFEYFYKQNLFGQHIRKCIKKNISDSFTSSLLKNVIPTTTSYDNNNNNNNNSPIIDIIIHDDIFFTKCLFSLSQNGIINGYKYNDNDDNNKQYKKILNYNKLNNEIALQIQQMTDDNQSYFIQNGLNQSSLTNMNLIRIFKIDKYESQKCQLMGITSNGDRLFFTISQNQHLWQMELSFIRIRPPFLNYNNNDIIINNNKSFEPSIQPSSSPKNVITSFHKNGITFINSLKNNNSDCLLLINRNNVETIKSKYYRPQLFESIECDINNINNNFILSITELPREKYVSHSSFMLYSRKEIKKLNAGKPFIGLSQFSIQHLLPCSIYLCLTTNCLVFYKLQRYIDQFKLLLNTRNYTNILNFVEKIGYIECEVMCLLIMINYEKKQETKEEGEEKKEEEIYVNEAYKLFMTPIKKEIDILYQDIMQRLGLQSTKILSIYLCLSRLLRPIWSSTICILNIAHNHQISARYSCHELYRIINPLSRFKKIIISINQNDIYKDLLFWISKCIQILNILILLTRCHFNNIYDSLSSSNQTLLKHICFQQLITRENGTNLLCSIISIMILKLNDNDIKRLHIECPSYFTSAQFITFLAKSQLNDTSTLQNALTMFCDVCDDKSFDLQNVCNLLITHKYYNGVIKLIFCLQNKLIYKINQFRKQQNQIKQILQIQIQQQQQQQIQHQQQQINHLNNFQQEINKLNNRIIAAWNQIFKCLHILYIDSTTTNDQYLAHNKQRVLRQCLNESNRDFSYKFYQWFLDNKLIHILFKYKPKYLENFLSENLNETERENNKTTLINKGRNNRLIKLVYFYKENREISKMIQLLDALTKSTGFELEERNNFLIEAKRATKLLNQNGTNFDPHNVITDKYNKFEEKSILCQIQLNIYNKLQNNTTLQNVSEQDLKDLNYKLLNLERLFLICKQYELYQYALDCLSFTNDSNIIDHINSIWIYYIANIIKEYGPNEWTIYLLSNFYKIVNKYNLQQQPWMFDIFRILLYLNKMNYQTHKKVSDTIIIDIIYPKINNIKYQQLITNYKLLLNQIDNQYKINIIHSIYYLLTKKKHSILIDSTMTRTNNKNNNYANPRLLIDAVNVNVANNNNTTSHSILIDSTTSNINDLISNCINYLQRQNMSHNTEIIKLTKQFQNLSQNYSL